MDKACYGFEALKKAEETGDASLLVEVERVTELPIVYRGNATIVQGTSNIAHYDFTTASAVEDICSALVLNPTLFWRISGFGCLSYKQLEKEQYLFNVPANPPLFERLKKTQIGEERVQRLRESQGLITPDNYVAGFHIFYEGSACRLMPVIGEKEAEAHKKYLAAEGYRPAESLIVHVGNSSPYGQWAVAPMMVLG
ncbi:MAG: hypothetical protein HY518_03860 [Candidatus Aenigmarchaeota archaeon]|nr:hypothetical protein [Candidatus Aenigmarchaeota archaeon]